MNVLHVLSQQCCYNELRLPRGTFHHSSCFCVGFRTQHNVITGTVVTITRTTAIDTSFLYARFFEGSIDFLSFSQSRLRHVFKRCLVASSGGCSSVYRSYFHFGLHGRSFSTGFQIEETQNVEKRKRSATATKLKSPGTKRSLLAFKRCTSCNLKITVTDTHDNFLTCLGMKHPMFRCTQCLALKWKASRAHFLCQRLWYVLYKGDKESNTKPPSARIISTKLIAQNIIELQGKDEYTDSMKKTNLTLTKRLTVKSKLLRIYPLPSPPWQIPSTPSLRGRGRL